MMRFKHSHRSGNSLAFSAPRGAAILIAALAGGCSAEISRFDFPGFSLTDDKKDSTSSLQQTASADRGPSYLGNERSPGSYDRGGYTAPRSYGENRVAAANLPEPAPSTPSYNYLQRRSRLQHRPPLRPGPGRPPAFGIASGRKRRGAARRHALRPVAPPQRFRRRADGGQRPLQPESAPRPEDLSAAGLCGPARAAARCVHGAAQCAARERAAGYAPPRDMRRQHTCHSCRRPPACRRSITTPTRCAAATRSTGSRAPTACP